MLNKIQSRFYKTRIFKGLLGDYMKHHPLITKATAEKHTQTVLKQLEEKHQSEVQKVIQEQTEKIPVLVQAEIQKVETMNRNTALRHNGIKQMNGWNNPDRKPGSDIPFSYLRRMAVLYPIARACINRRVRQITQLDWDITTIDEIDNEKGYESKINEIMTWLKAPMGHKTRFREMLTIIVDDVLTLDAVTFEMQKRRNGKFMYLIPVDPTTIALRLTETGGTPIPPEVAYAQYIAGQKVGDFTTDEMIYEAMNNRSYSPYGLAPLESLILQTESALRGTLFNLNYLRENNVPEGFITLPEEVAANKDQVQEWQDWFDAILAGDMRTIHRLKILPGGAEYTPVKKMEDMSFEKFELWLLQQTCAVFDVTPQDIGITYQVNKATGEIQKEISQEKGLYPLGNFIKEILDDIIQVEFEIPQLQFKWMNINPVDRKEESDIALTEINMGAMSVDEYRINRGLEPIGLGHYVKTGTGIQLVTDIISGVYKPQVETSDQQVTDDAEKMEKEELRKWRKCIYRDLDSGRPLRVKFPSDKISGEVRKIIQDGLQGVNSKQQAKLLFDQFLDFEVGASMRLLKIASDMRRLENAEFSEN